MRDKIKRIIPVIGIVILTIMFFSYSPIITFDTSHYLSLTNILKSNNGFSQWDVARGIVFPLIIHMSNILLGHNSNGILMLMYIAYVAMIIVICLIYKFINEKTDLFKGRLKQIILLIVTLILIIVNPMIFGYYHVLLTEFIAITISIIMCYLSWKWIDVDFKENKIKYIAYTIIFSLSTALSWHLKQPYVTITLFPVIVGAVISIIKRHDKINILQRGITILSCIITLCVSLITWNIVIKIWDVKIDEKRTSSGFLSNGILTGLSRLQERENKSDEVDLEKYNITEKEKEEIEKIKQDNSKYKNFTIYENKSDNAKDLVLFTKNDIVSTGETIKFWFKALVTEPITVVRSYLDNFLGITDVYEMQCIYNQKKETTELIILNKIDILGTLENKDIGYRIYSPELPNFMGFIQAYEQYALPYNSINAPLRIPNVMMKILRIPIILVTKIALLMLPFVLIGEIIISIRKRKRYTEEMKKIINLIIILLSYSFLHIVLHVVLGAAIDRYTVPVMVPVFLSYIIILFIIINNYKKNKESKNEKM